MKTIFRYHGGKTKIAPWIVSKMPFHKCYVEPFGGGASVLLAKPTTLTEVYNDIDKEVFNVFKVIREHPEALIHALKYTPYSREELQHAYSHTDDPIEAARRFIVKGHMAFSTCGQNANVGFRAAINSGDYASQAYTFSNIWKAIDRIRTRFERVILENCNAFDLLPRYDKEQTLWYFDPPYVNDTRSNSSVKKGYAHNMTDPEHEFLLQKIKLLKGSVMISGYDTEMYRDYLRGWQCFTTKGFTDSKIKTSTESLWLNYKINLLF